MERNIIRRNKMISAEEAFKISIENLDERIEKTLKGLEDEISHSAQLGRTWIEYSLDKGLVLNSAFITAVEDALREKNFNVCVITNEGHLLSKIEVRWGKWKHNLSTSPRR